MTLDELNSTAKTLVDGLEIDLQNLIEQYNTNSNHDYLIDDTELVNAIEKLKSRIKIFVPSHVVDK
tara:strand:- start:133 stop:330 length:198 start_codon:yes stop_codon:yes gene_type:complete